MKQYRICLFLISITFAACGDGEAPGGKELSPNPDSVTNTVLERPLRVLDSLSVNEYWEDFHREQHPFFEMEEFIEVTSSQAQILQRQMALDSSFYTSYGPVLVYNPDSSAFADIYSYSLIIENKNGKRTARRGEPDSEVAVVNPNTGIRTRYLFCGPACVFELALWVDHQNLAIMGLTDDDGDEIFRPAVWVINTRLNEIRQYKYPEQINRILPRAFTRKYLKEKGVELRG